MGEFAVELRDVVKKFITPEGSELAAVNHVTMQIRHGEFFSMLGSSGCGKTTTLRMIAGFEWPTEGEIYIDGVAMGHTPPYQRTVNTVFQSYALFQHMNVFQNVAFGLEMEGVSKDETKKRVGRALEMVQLTGMDRRFPKQLSGGQQQRVALARALVKTPKVLLLDEPLGALDLKLRKEMQLELKALQQELGITFIYVTHDQEEALTMSDRIAVMSLGRVLQMGPAVEIYERPTSRFVADFIGESNFLEGKVKSVSGDQAVVVIPAWNEDLTGIAMTQVKVGDDVAVSIRPEKIRLTEDARIKENCIEGSVVSSTYIGSDTHVYLDVRGQRVKVWEQNRISTLDPRAYYQKGQKVWLSLMMENTLVLPRD
ncbi:MAG: ABC transporter ATP-binding protein [Chloroflexi bacterium]|nr:ABC transporter ATP-binding protein [Chloroflexota bacterium]